MVALSDLDFARVREQSQHGTISSPGEQLKLEQDLAKPYSRESPNAGVAASEPPLYYALETIPYNLAGGTLLDRLSLMRLMSALMAGFTSLFIFLFIRESLPSASWSWIVGGLAVSLFPLLGMMSGAVNPDAMLYAVSAALFFGFARTFKRGFTPRRGAAIGALIAVGLLTKLNFIGLLPGAVVGLLALTFRAARVSKPAAYRSLVLALSIAAIPAVLYAGVNAVGHHTINLTSVGLDFLKPKGSLLRELGYTWELYMPRLPGMPSYFHHISTTRQLWFNGFVGLYGWLDTVFPAWVDNAALIPAGLIAGLCINELARHRAALRRRGTELITYGAMIIGTMTLVGVSDYRYYPSLAGEYLEPRYMLSLAAVAGAALSLAARGAGRRWGRTVGTLIVVLFLAHDIFSQLLVVSRYYG
jgi:4-amino-4-deoxy-L-arabinose transferase-like glycosyltransferase